jgi:uncharacterized alkaline shock family protein YloU
MNGRASVSTAVLARYAADAACEVEGVRGLVGHVPRHRGVRIVGDDGHARVELHVALAWGASAPDVGRAVQRRVGEYLERMTGTRPAGVDVVVDEIGPPA